MSDGQAKVSMVYFAGARDLARCERELLDFDGSMSEPEFKRWLGAQRPALAPYLERMRLAVDGDFMTDASRVQPGSEVTVLPPVAGGSDDHETVFADVSDQPLSVDAMLARVQHAGAGGICVFLGVVRDHADGKSVARLDYEAYQELAVKEMTRILMQIVDECPGARVAVSHRVGQLAIGDAAVVVAASAPHRAEAFTACRAAIDRIKETVPIWKKEWDEGGNALWVNLEPGAG